MIGHEIGDASLDGRDQGYFILDRTIRKADSKRGPTLCNIPERMLAYFFLPSLLLATTNLWFFRLDHILCRHRVRR
jgi:hypothetical protein